jgi:hypothetical protein
LIFAIGSGGAVALKRFILGLRFGTTSYYRYSEKLSSTLKQILLVSQLARSTALTKKNNSCDRKNNDVLQKWYHASKEDEPNGFESRDNVLGSMSARSDDDRNDTAWTKSQQIKIDQLLGEWEDIGIMDNVIDNPSLSSIVQFRSSMSVLSSDFPFSPTFGRARTRADVVEGAQRLYMALLRKQDGTDEEDDVNDVLRFHTIALAALTEDGSFDYKMAKDLVTLFRPARDGDIRLLEFCKSIDMLYKEIRILRVSIANEGRMNAASELFLNIVFYFLLSLIGLGIIGVDFLVLIGFMASIILSVSFMISKAASDYFAGLLFILVQRPYDIGDRIAIADPQSDANASGSSGWMVKDVTL